jgi:hypothetical protein
MKIEIRNDEYLDMAGRLNGRYFENGHGEQPRQFVDLLGWGLHLGHEDAARWVENDVCAREVPPRPAPFPVPAPPPAPVLGPLSVRDGRLWDGTRYFGWRGVSEFDAIHAVLTGRRSDLQRRFDRAAANGCNGIRVLMMARNLFQLDPGQAGYWPAVDVAVQDAHQRGLYVELVLFADAQAVMPNPAARIEFAAEFAAWANGRPGLLPQYANEAAFNGWSGATDPLLFDIVGRTTLTMPFSISDPSDYVADTDTGEPLRGEFVALSRRSPILVLHAERKAPDTRWAGWVDHLKGFDEVCPRDSLRYRIHDEPMGAAADWQPGRRDNRPDAHRAAALVCAVLGIGYTYHYISAQSDATPGLDGQKIAAQIPQTPDFQFKNAGTGGACVRSFSGWDKIRTCDNGREAWAVAYGHPAVPRSIEWADGWSVQDTVIVGQSVTLFRATRA